MLASAPFLLLHLRCLPPSLLILGSAPTFITAMALLRALTLPLPPSVFWRAEERLYSAYQAMVGFFFESWSGVEVSLATYSVGGGGSDKVDLCSLRSLTSDWRPVPAKVWGLSGRELPHVRSLM